MEYMPSSDLKTILHSKRANLYYLEHCRVLQKDGRIVYLTPSKQTNHYYNIPVANTTVLLLGTGTSVTQSAMRMLSQAGVLVGFCGGGATPLFAATEVEWLTPQSEYRPTEYIQGWLAFWFKPNERLRAARTIQTARADYLERVWGKDRDFFAGGISMENAELTEAIERFRQQVRTAPTVTDLLSIEARLTKHLYKQVASSVGLGGFVRTRDATDQANSFLNHGNYLAYGLAASTLWVLGIPHGFAVLHGKTRRGALVFDVADLVKDALVLPWAFLCAAGDYTEQGFREQCLQAFTTHKALDYMFSAVKAIALSGNSANSATEGTTSQ